MVNGYLISINNRSNGEVDRAIRNASRAVCGTFEKEITVKASKVPQFAKALEKRGYRVLGTSYEKPKAKSKKLWFVPMGAGSL